MRSRGRTRPNRGIVTGYVLKLARESIPASQERLAAALGVDRATVQSWEIGRRPVTSVAVGQFVAVRRKLAAAGADPGLLRLLDQAPEADLLVETVLDADPATAELARHPLGWTVLTHSLTALVAWAVAGAPPAGLPHRPAGRRGPVPTGPRLEPTQRRAFFDHLRVLADRTARREPGTVLLHRQACFLAGLDPSGRTAAWLGTRPGDPTVSVDFHSWSPLWPDARSVAASLARQGDPQMLREFIARAHPDDACELAGLTYWAYWVGEIDQPQRDDLFMVDGSWSWRGGRLLSHLVHRLHTGHAYLDLNIHSIWALLAARRGLALDDPALGQRLRGQAERVLDENLVSAQSRRELVSIIYGLRASGYTGKGRADDCD